MSAKTTRERILQEGLALMSRDGLDGVTLGVLAERAGMSKSGLFAHFGSKEEVQIELLRHTARVVERETVAPTLAQPEGLPRLRALVERWFGWSGRAGLPGGCPVAAALFELDDVESAVRDEVLAMEGQWRGFLEQVVSEAVARGHLRRDLDVEQFVWELCGIYLGHHTSGRFLRALDADHRARVAFESLLARSGAGSAAS